MDHVSAAAILGSVYHLGGLVPAWEAGEMDVGLPLEALTFDHLYSAIVQSRGDIVHITMPTMQLQAQLLHACMARSRQSSMVWNFLPRKVCCYS